MNSTLKCVLLSTTLICCTQGYTTNTIVYDPIRDILTNGEDLSKCDVYLPNTVTDANYGKLYYGSDNNKKYLIDNEGIPFIDYETAITEGNTNWNAEPWKTYYSGKINLIIKKNSTITHTNQVSGTNFLKLLVIPKGSTLSSDSSSGKTPLISLDSGFNFDILLLGTVQSTMTGASGDFMTATSQIGYGNTNIIVGPKAKLDCSTSSSKAPISSTNSPYNMKFLFYPNSEIKNQSTAIEVIPQSQLILNRYTTTDSKLNTLVNQNANITFPTSVKSNLTHNSTETTTSLFSTIKWNASATRTDNTIEGSAPSQCLFKDPESPLSYNLYTNENDSIRNDKAILGLNPANEFAKYDVALWNECKIDGKYGFAHYNKPAYSGNYIDIDLASKLFSDVKDTKDANSGKLQLTSITLKTNKIYPGLIGNRKIILDTTDNDVYFYGDNREFQGNIDLPNTVKKVYYDNEKSAVHNLKQDIPLKPDEYIYFFIQGRPVCDLFGLHGTINDLTQYQHQDGTVVLYDSGHKKHITLFVKGDNSNFKGVIVTTPFIDEVVFDNNSFVRTIKVNGKPLKYIFNGSNHVIDYSDYKELDVNNANIKVTSNNLQQITPHTIYNNNYNVLSSAVLQFGPGTKCINTGTIKQIPQHNNVKINN
ncbi:MAG: hypothetical protein IJ848_00750 [Alphaproteobacteria bacterium]|nr:hypothetical protein [Alphaproteobacteria bacterium]